MPPHQSGLPSPKARMELDASRVAALRGVVDQLAACEEALQGCVDDAQRLLGPHAKFVPVTAQTPVILALARALGRVRPRRCVSPHARVAERVVLTPRALFAWLPCLSPASTDDVCAPRLAPQRG